MTSLSFIQSSGTSDTMIVNDGNHVRPVVNSRYLIMALASILTYSRVNCAVVKHFL